MTPRKAIKISTPTPEELQALYDLPSETSEVEESSHSSETLRRLQALEEGNPVQCYNEIVRSIDALYEAAAGGADLAVRFLYTLARSAIIEGGPFA